MHGWFEIPDWSARHWGAAAPTNAAHSKAAGFFCQSGPLRPACEVCSADAYSFGRVTYPGEVSFASRTLNSFFPRALFSSMHDSFARINSLCLCTKMHTSRYCCAGIIFCSMADGFC